MVIALYMDENLMPNKQQLDFTNLLQKLGTASPTEIEIALAERETVEPEKELTPQIITQFQQRLRSKV